MAVVGKVPTLLQEEFKTLALATAGLPAWAAANGAFIAAVIKQHNAWLTESGVEKYQAAYDGELESITVRNKSRGDDINHKVQVNLAKILIETAVDYMLGKPFVWAFEKDGQTAQQNDKDKTLQAYRVSLLQLLETEEARRVLREMLTQGSVAGFWTALGWVDEKGLIDYEDFPVQEMVPVYDSRGRLRLVLRTFLLNVATPGQDPVEVRKVEVYDGRYAAFLVAEEGSEDYKPDMDETPQIVEHKAARIPVSVFINGTPARYKERQKKAGVSDLGDGILTVLEEYAGTVSDKANTVDRVLDQFLVFLGATLGGTKQESENEVLAMRKARAIALKNQDGDAKFIAPSQEDTAVENHLNRLRETAHAMAFTPEINKLAGATATEIKLKYAGLDIKAGKKEIYFTGAVRQMLRFLTDFLNAKRLQEEAHVADDNLYAILSGEQTPPSSVELYDAEWVDFTVNHNLPQNYQEIATIVSTLSGKVPDSYLYELLWFIEDPKKALDEMKAQKEAAMASSFNAMMGGGEFTQTGAAAGGAAAGGAAAGGAAAGGAAAGGGAGGGSGGAAGGA